ncbi:MAG: bifunctional histidinol-phosphatase/imidazoleglycerol-phosphate dehydratase HisB [Pseudomonadota bacterium]
MTKIAFIDRDGTIVKEPHDFQVDRLEKIQFVDDAIPCLLQLQQMNYKLVMVSNQDGRGTKTFPEEDFSICHDFIMGVLKSQGVIFQNVLICPHFARENCSCRKPNLGLLTPYLHQFDPIKSFVVGDRTSDEQLAINLGIPCYRIDQMSWTDVIQSLRTKEPQVKVTRKTNETDITMSLAYKPGGTIKIQTGNAFFDHMLEQIVKYGNLSIDLTMTGDWQIDDHHSIEDVAIVLGQGLSQLLGDRAGLGRFGFVLPMDESLCRSALDLSGRSAFQFDGQFARETVNGLSTEMIPHFFKTLSDNLKAAIHIDVRGENVHHQIESCFKSVGKSLGQALKREGYGIPSTKGLL